jgi:hypothetical protein
MQGIGKSFFTSALVYGVLGMLLGLEMAMRKNHGQMPTHAHIMVIGWVSFAIFGMFYSVYGSTVPRLLALAHLWLSQITFALLVVGLYLIYSGKTQFDPLAAIGSIGYAVSFLIFAAGAVSAMRTKPA